MRCSLSGPLAVLLLAVASTPCPAGRLDDTTHNVGVEDILAPRGTIDSGQTIIPRVVIVNVGNEPADSVSAYLMIDDGTPGGYIDSLPGLNIPALTTETLAFPGWIPRGRDSMTVVAWTECAGDTFPANDTCRQRFLVRVKDIAVTQIISPAPDTTLDSGAVMNLQARVWNYGNVSLRFDVRFRIWRIDTVPVPPDYESRRHMNLIAGGATLVTAPDSWEPKPGTWTIEVFAIVPGDLHPGNNILGDTFRVRGTITYDMDMRAVYVWPNPAYVGDTVTITAVVGGVDTATLWVFADVTDSLQQRVFYDSQQVHLPGPNPSWRVVISEPGPYAVVCSLYWFPDRNLTNNAKLSGLRVYPRPGVEEEANGEGRMANSGASVLRFLPPGAVVFDAMGRRVLDPKPGVYFVVTPHPDPLPQGERENSAVSIRKVILQH